VWLALTGASAAATVLVLPYAFTLNKNAIEKAREKASATGRKVPSTAQMAALGALQGGLQFGLVAALGLRAARPMGLGAPHLSRLLEGRPSRLRGESAARYAAAGAGIALAMGAVDLVAFRKVRDELKRAGMREPEPWKGLLASFYGGIAEEVLMRLGAQTLAAAGLRKAGGERGVPATGRVMWPAIALSNLLFGAGHLPAASSIMPLTPLFVARTLTLNAMAGVVFGYLYWKEGLEAAMIAHGSTDLVLHVLGAAVDRR
jgi:membrane protease YdiL (CAAX protease family)